MQVVHNIGFVLFHVLLETSKLETLCKTCAAVCVVQLLRLAFALRVALLMLPGGHACMQHVGCP